MNSKVSIRVLLELLEGGEEGGNGVFKLIKIYKLN